MGADSIDRDKARQKPHPLRTKRAYLAAAIYSFIGFALVWQFAFVMITRDVHRYSALMPVTVLEKLTSGLPALILYMHMVVCPRRC